MKNRILIIDDDKEFLEELTETLSLSGYETISVEDPDRIREIVGKTIPDVILLDLKMPKKTGFQVAYELNEYPEWAQVPIIAMSAYFNQEKMSIPPMFRIKKCLKKPFNPLDVITEINNAIQS
jgi:two-component system, sensor histidine kinase and response regulator